MTTGKPKALDEAVVELESPPPDLFRYIVENIDAVFWMREIRGGKLSYISPSYEKIWGRPRRELFERDDAWLDAIHPEDRHLVKRVYDQALQRERVLEYRIVHRDGSIRWIRSRISPILDDAGQPCLEVGIAEDFTERQQLLARILRAEQNLRDFAEEEQLRIARDLHDEFGQLLPSLRWRIDEFCRGESGGNGRGGDESCQFIGNMLDLIGESVRRTIRRLRSDAIEKIGFLASLECKVAEFGKIYPDIKASLTLLGAPQSLAYQQEMALYRLFQEALTNVAKHAAADRVEVRLIFSFPSIILDIRDNGCGFNPEIAMACSGSTGTGLGLLGMRERIQREGGTLRIKSSKGAGTAIRADLPLKARSSEGRVGDKL